LPVLVVIFTNKTQLEDCPDLTNFCLKKDILVQSVIQRLEHDKNDSEEIRKFALNLGIMPGMVESFIEGFVQFDDETKLDILNETFQKIIHQTKSEFQNTLILKICDDLVLKLTINESLISYDSVQIILP
jgi:hypothetical protein